jgi:RNA polymerase sigma-70 factor (ECF subfamily)
MVRPEAGMQDLTLTVDLVRRAQAGDSEALDRICARYWPRVLRIVRMTIGPGLRHQLESQDIVQQSWLEALKSFDRFEMREEGSLIRWLARVVERQICAAADHAGAQKRGGGRPALTGAGSSTAPGLGPTVEDAAPGPCDRVAEQEQLAQVDHCVRDLPELERELVLRRDYAGESWRAIAEALGLPSADAARMRHAAAKVLLVRSMLARRHAGA